MASLVMGLFLRLDARRDRSGDGASIPAAVFANRTTARQRGPWSRLASGGDFAEAAALEVDHRLPDLFGSVHDKGAVHDHRFIDRLAAQDQQCRVALRLQRDPATV